MFSTINVFKISIEDQRELEKRPHFDRSVLNDSFGNAFTKIDQNVIEIFEYVREKKSQEAIQVTHANPPILYLDWFTAENILH